MSERKGAGAGGVIMMKGETEKVRRNGQCGGMEGGIGGEKVDTVAIGSSSCCAEERLTLLFARYGSISDVFQSCMYIIYHRIKHLHNFRRQRLN